MHFTVILVKEIAKTYCKHCPRQSEDCGCCTTREVKAKKKVYEKNALSQASKTYKARTKASCQDGLNCQNPLFHSLKLQLVTLKHTALLLASCGEHSTAYCVSHTHIYTHTHYRKNYSISCVHTFQDSSCTSFLLPKCSISIREGNGKFACACMKTHIQNKRIHTFSERVSLWYLC